MSSSKIRLGLIGCGARLRVIVQELLKATDQVEITALNDPDPRAIEAIRDEFHTEATVHDDFRRLVRDPAVDWVMIGSWNCHHAGHAIAAFEAGKDVFCEKPLATTLPDCLAIRDAWNASGRSFTIGFTLRYSPHFVRLKKMLAEGGIGRIVSLEFNETLRFGHGGFIHADWRRHTAVAGSHLLEKCCHDIDLVNWLVGSNVRRVASFGGLDFFRPENVGHMKRLGRDPVTGRTAYRHFVEGQELDPFTSEKDIVDNQVAILEFANGVRATFHTNCNSAIPERRMYICGTEGALRADVLTGRIEFSRIGFDSTIEDMSAGVSGQHGGGDEVLGQSLADSMLHGTPPCATLDDGLRAAITCFGIDEALATGAVVDLSDYWKQARLDGAAVPSVPAV